MFGNPVLGPRIVPFASARLETDVLPNGHPGFRVTQRFDDWDAIFHTEKHGALDLGNWHCGDAVVAMADGVVTPLGDPNGAIGQNIDHDNGYSTQYYHLSRRVELIGQRVKKGRTIGYVGKTGLNTAGCHLHVVVINPKRQLVDPWPLLDQNRPTPVPPSGSVPWRATMYTIGVPFIRLTPGGVIVAKAKLGQTFRSIRIVTGPAYADQRTGRQRHDWVIVEYQGATASVAKSFMKTRSKL